MGNISTNGTITANSFIGNATHAYRLLNQNSFSSRLTTLDLSPDGSGDVLNLKATSSLTSGAAKGDGHVLHFYWDNSGWWDAQLLVPNSGTRPIQFRHQNGSSWENWITVLDQNNYSDYALPKTGGTLTGRVIVKDTKADMKQTNNGASSVLWGGGYRTVDTNDLLSFWIQPTFYTDGAVTTTLGTRNYDTSGTIVADANISLTAKKNGVACFQINTNLVLDSSGYGSSLPTGGLITGRVFYKLT